MRRSTLFTFLFIAILGLIGYIWYGYLQTPGMGEVAPEEDFIKVLAEVSRLKNLNLDTSFFQDRFFIQLEAPQAIVEPEVAPGRTNPFAAFR